MLLGQLIWLQGRAVAAERRLAALVDLADSDPRRAALASLRFSILGYGLSRPADARRVAEEAEASITDQSCRDEVTACRARDLNWQGQHAAAAALAEPLLERATGPTLVSACIAAASALDLTGRTAAAIEATQRGLSAHLALAGPPLAFSPTWHPTLRAFALHNAGRLSEAATLARSEYDKAVVEGSIEGRATSSFVLAWTFLAQGRPATAGRWARDGAVEWRQIGWSLALRMTLIAHVHALALQGDVPSARAVLADIDGLGVPPAHLFGPDLLRARAWVEVADGGAADGHAHLEEAVAMARAGGARTVESRLLHGLARLGRPIQVAPRLRELAATVEGPLAAASAAHAEALAGADAAGLSAAAASFEELGAILLAAEASADSAVAWRRAFEPRKATAAEQRSTCWRRVPKGGAPRP